MLARLHGTRSRYVTGCRCTHCRRAQADYSREYRARPPKTPAPLTVLVFHENCGEWHVVRIPRRSIFPSNGALARYIGETMCGRFTLYVYRRA